MVMRTLGQRTFCLQQTVAVLQRTHVRCIHCMKMAFHEKYYTFKIIHGGMCVLVSFPDRLSSVFITRDTKSDPCWGCWLGLGRRLCVCVCVCVCVGGGGGGGGGLKT